MATSHQTTTRVGNEDYDYNIITVTKGFGGARTRNSRTSIYLEDSNGKVETLDTDFDIDIPPTTQLISTLYGEDKKSKKTFLWGIYIHSNDFVGWTTNAAKENAADRIIPLRGFAAKREKWGGLITLFLSLLFAWNGLWTGQYYDYHGMGTFFSAFPYVLANTPDYIANFALYSREHSYGWGFMGLVAGFTIAKLLFAIPHNRLRNKIRTNFGNDMSMKIPQIFAGQAKTSSPISGHTNSASQTDADGYQTLI